VEFAQRQGRVPVDAIGEPYAEVAAGSPLACRKLQLRQVDDFQVTADRAAQTEIPRWPAQGRVEVAQVTAVVILQQRIHPAQGHRWLFYIWIKPAPGKVAPGQLRFATQSLTPTQLPLQLDQLGIAGIQLQ